MNPWKSYPKWSNSLLGQLFEIPLFYNDFISRINRMNLWNLTQKTKLPCFCNCSLSNETMFELRQFSITLPNEFKHSFFCNKSMLKLNRYTSVKPLPKQLKLFIRIRRLDLHYFNEIIPKLNRYRFIELHPKYSSFFCFSWVYLHLLKH